MKKRENMQDEYCFVKEVIKEKPVSVRGLLIRCTCLLAGAVVFGLISALVFVHFFPIFQEHLQAGERVVFEEDDPTITPAPVQEIAVDAGLEEDLSAGTGINDPVASEPNALDNYQKMYEDINDIAQSVMDSMVTVTSISNDEDWFLVTTQSEEDVSGVVIAENEYDFYILTEYRAVEQVDRVMVTFSDGSIADGRYQMHDTNTGLTVLKVSKEDLTQSQAETIRAVCLGNSYQVRQGERVIAIGSPMGYSNSIVHGQITSITGTAFTYDAQYDLIITNILGSEDGSGVLLNLSGEVIGLITQKFGRENHKNVIQCLQISQLKTMITALSNGEELPYLGIKGQNVTAEITKQTGMPKGVYVNEVKIDSPALQAGVQKADILTQYNGKKIETMHQYSELLSKAAPGDTVELTIMRKGMEGYVEFQFPVILESR